MKTIITNVSYQKKYFMAVLNGKKHLFYLAPKYEPFCQYLDNGVLIEYEISGKTKLIDNFNGYEVISIKFIKALKANKVIFDMKEVKKTMVDILKSNNYFLVIDFEMTLADYRKRKSISEIIQVGYYLVDHKINIVMSDGYYLLPTLTDELNPYTLKFLSINSELYYGKAKPYFYFYQRLKKIIDNYQPKLIIWGKNDFMSLEQSYKINNEIPLTTKNDFIDLLKIHKNFFSLKNDPGLFKTYQIYYNVSKKQIHDAQEDAFITKEILKGFFEEAEREGSHA